MLLTTWLSAAKRQLLSPKTARRPLASHRASAGEHLESRMLLTALVIDQDNVASFTNAAGTLEVNSLGANDSLVIERLTFGATANGISINLANTAVERIAIESVNVTSFVGIGIDINLTNVTGLRTLVLEDVEVEGSDLGVDITLDNTDIYALTIDDSAFPGVKIDATNNSDIFNGLINQNTISSGSGFEAIDINVNTGGTANNFGIRDNLKIDALDRDAVRLDFVDAPVDGLIIDGNAIGAEPGADVLVRAEGDTFEQPFRVRNNANDGERITQFQLDLSPLGLVFDENGLTGKPFNHLGTGPALGFQSAIVSNNGSLLTVTFDNTGFSPGEELRFLIDVDIAPTNPGGSPIPASIFGNDLIGALIRVDFTAGVTPGSVPKSVTGSMVGDANEFTASEFVVGASSAGNQHGVYLNLDGSPATNTTITNNVITGVPGHGVFIDAQPTGRLTTITHSDVAALISGNTITSSGRDGVHLNMVDSNFQGAVINNTIGANSGNGISVQPSVTREGLIEAALDGAPIVITSTNHGLQDGDTIIIQGMVNDNPNVVHPGNGIHVIRRLPNDNHRFELVGTNALASNIVYVGGGAWYVPDFTSGLVEDVDDTNPVVITTTDHGLQTGDTVVLTGIGNADPNVTHPANGAHAVTVIDSDTFSLDGVDGTPADVNYTTGGGWYKELLPGETPRGLVTIDLQADESRGVVRSLSAPGATNVVLTTPNHGLVTGDRIRVRNVQGVLGINAEHKVIVTGPDTFELDGFTTAGTYDTSVILGTWVGHPISNAVTTANGVEITSIGHGLVSGDQVRILGVLGNTAANGTHTVVRIDDDTFLIDGLVGNGVYTSGGRFVALSETDFHGDKREQRVGGNSITGNGLAGFYANLQTGSVLFGDVVGNSISANQAKGVHIESHSFGLGTDLHRLDPNDNLALPGLQDISFDLNIGTDSPDDRNIIDQNVQAGIVIEAFDYATGSFEIRGNTITSTQDDGNSGTPYQGDGIVVRLTNDQLPPEAVALLAESVIDNNVIGVDNQGNEGNGLFFEQTQRTRIQDLVVSDNRFLNNGIDGFNFRRTEDADLNAVIFERNFATNNIGDGFEIFAENTVKDVIDFRINENAIDDNKEYGVRINLQADVRAAFEFNNNSVRRNGELAQSNQNGFHPNDGTGTTGHAGGVGITGFQQIEVTFNATETFFEGNFGDGFAIDAYNFFDTFTINTEFVDSTFNGNTLSGYRDHGSAFGTNTWTRSQFNSNGEDGARMVFNVDTNDFFDRRVGGQDISVIGLGNQFQFNQQNGAVLGQGVSAVFGNGSVTPDFLNSFSANVEDGLKIVQDAGPYLRDNRLRRVIETDRNRFTNNGGTGVDIGHEVLVEGNGNVLQGHEVVSDTDIIIARATITGNTGDGVEYLTDSNLRIPPVIGGGQDTPPNPDISSLTVSNSIVSGNGQRGIDILNRFYEDSRITIYNNDIISNGFSGIYVVNTSSHQQLQFGPDDPFHELFDFHPVGFITPNIELRVQDNLIESNGNASTQSRVLINASNGAGDANLNANDSYTPSETLVNGTLGGLVVRVGTAHSFGRSNIGNAGFELGLSGIDAEVWKNSFDGNFGADVYFDSFTSDVPDKSNDHFHTGDTPQYRWNRGYRDPLARLDLSFRENTGNSLDVVNGFAFLDNDEEVFKSRWSNGPAFPNDEGWSSPPIQEEGRFRNATRTLGFFDVVGNTPSFQFPLDPAPGLMFAYDGWGTPTWRVESDFDFFNFPQTSTISGHSDFFDVIELGNGFYNAEEHYQWDTGRNAPGFVGSTPYSLNSGDIFNVTGDPITADSLEENDSFIGATELGVVAGAGFSVNALATNGNLNIEKKGDRDYYRFTAADDGLLTLNLANNDATSQSNLNYLIYEVTPGRQSEEVPMVQAGNGLPLRSTVGPGSNGSLQVFVRRDNDYIVEILSTEFSNLGFTSNGKPFIYGTVDSYSLSIDAPNAPAPASGSGGGSSAVISDGKSGNTGGGASISGTLVSDPTRNPSVQEIVNVNQTAAPAISTAIDEITVIFTEDVVNVDITDFTLTRDGSPLDLVNAFISPTNAFTYVVAGLGDITGEAGDYELTLVAGTSGIQDLDGAALVGGNATETWTVANTITNTTDAVDAYPGDNLAADAGGNATLRAAIIESNTVVGNDIITLAAGTFDLTIDGRFEDGALSGDLDIAGHLTIRGAGPGLTIIDAHDLDRVFHVLPGSTLILENLTIMNGEAFDGGGIFVGGQQFADDGSLISDNTILTLTEVNVVNNEAYNQGGGIYNLGTIAAKKVSVSLNEAGSRGGGLFNHGVVTAQNTTFSTNHAVSRGGGIYTEGSVSTVNFNLQPVVNLSTIQATNVTIAANSVGADGGGIFVETNGTATIGNTLIDLNTSDDTFPDIAGIPTSLGHNLIGDLDGTRNAFQLDPTDLAGGVTDVPSATVDSGLQGLTNADGNGTWHHPLGPGDAVDAGKISLFVTGQNLLLENDQIGNPRLIEGNDDATLLIDIGAVELLINEPVAIFTATPNPVGQNETVSLNGSGSTHTNLRQGSITLYEWDFDYDGIEANFSADVSGPTARTTSTSYPTQGNRTVALRVVDNSRVPLTGTMSINAGETTVNGTGTLFSTEVSSGDALDIGGVRFYVRDVLSDTGLTVTRAATATISGASATVSQTDIFTLVIEVGAPRVPVITGPFAVTSDSTPTIMWENGTGTFALVIDNLTTGQNGVVSASGLTVQSFTTGALPEGQYRVTVSATNANGTTSSVPYTFEIVRMTLSRPVDRSTGFDISPEFEWTAVGNTSRYELWVNQFSPVVKARIIHQQFLTGSSNTFEALAGLPIGSYRAWVRAFDDNSVAGDWSAGVQFTIGRAEVTGPAPVTHATLDRTPTITWNSLGAPQTELWVTQLSGVNESGAPLTAPRRIIYEPLAPGESFTPTTDLPNGVYRIWVRPIADDGEAGLWSRSYDLAVEYGTGPALISPSVRETDRTPEFVWNAIDGADHYELWVNDATRGVARRIHNVDVPHVDGVQTINYTDPDALPLRTGTYRWWVRAFSDTNEATAWSGPVSFFVPAPVVFGPSGTVTNTNVPTFTWLDVPEYVRYELWVDNRSTGEIRVLYQPNLTGTQFPGDPNDPNNTDPTSYLPLANGDYRIWLRGFDDRGNASHWSNPVDFTLQGNVTSAPQQITPVQTVTTDNTPFFEWTALANVTDYQIIVRRITSLDQTTVIDRVVEDATNFTPTSNLNVGKYRWWVRGINADGNGGVWSQPSDFRIVSNDVPTTEPSVFDEFEPILASVNSSETWTDEIESIAVHPAQVVAVVRPTVTEDAAADESSAVSVSEVDSVMAAWDSTSWWKNMDVDESELTEAAADNPPAVAMAEPVIQRNDKVASASLLGLGLGMFTRRRRPKKRPQS